MKVYLWSTLVGLVIVSAYLEGFGAQRAVDINRLAQALGDLSDREALRENVNLVRIILKNQAAKDQIPKDLRRAFFLKYKRATNYLYLAKQLSDCMDDPQRNLAKKILAGASTVDPCQFLSDFKPQLKLAENINDVLERLQQSRNQSEDLKSTAFLRKLHQQSVLDTLASKWTLDHTFPSKFAQNCRDVGDERNFASFATAIRAYCEKYLALYKSRPDQFPTYIGNTQFEVAAGQLKSKVKVTNSQLKILRANLVEIDWGTTDAESMRALAELEFQGYFEAHSDLTRSPAGRLIYTPQLLKKIRPLQTPHNVRLKKGQFKLAFHDASPLTARNLKKAFSYSKNQIKKRMVDLEKMRVKLNSIDKAVATKRANHPQAYDSARMLTSKSLNGYLEDLLKKNPLSVGIVLLKNPQYASSVCEVVDKIVRDDHRRKNVLKGIEYASFAVGLIPIGGWAITGTSLLVKSALVLKTGRMLAGRGLTQLANVGGVAFALSTALEARASKALLRDNQEIQLLVNHTDAFKPFQKELKGQLDGYRSDLRWAILSGVLAPVSAVSLAKNLKVAASSGPKALKAALSEKKGLLVLLEDPAAKHIAIATNSKNLTQHSLKTLKTLTTHFQKTGEKGAELSIRHLKQMIQEVLSKDQVLAKQLQREGFDLNSFIRGVVSSDMGKSAPGYKELFTTTSKRSNYLIDFLTGKGPRKSRKALQELLKENGNGGKTLIGSELTSSQVRTVFKEVPILQGYFHELPGMVDAVLAYERGLITTSEFKTQVATILFHNGPESGFWKGLTKMTSDSLSKAAKGASKKGLDPDILKNFAKGTIFEGKVTAAGVSQVKYSGPTNFEGALHTLKDRIHGTQGGVFKFFEELRDLPMADLVKVSDLLVGNPVTTLEQVKDLSTHIAKMKNLKWGQRQILQKLVGAHSKRLQKFIDYNKKNVKVVTGEKGAIKEIRLISTNKRGQRVITRLDGGLSYDEMIKEVGKFLKTEGKINPEPLLDLALLDRPIIRAIYPKKDQREAGSDDSVIVYIDENLLQKPQDPPKSYLLGDLF